MNKYQFTVKDMTCEGYARKIRDALKRVTGVENVINSVIPSKRREIQ